MKRFPILLFTFILINVNAQIEESAIIVNPAITTSFEARKAMANTRNINGIELPFVDDFSIDHFIGNAAGNEVLWEDLSAYRNLSYGIDPPTIGVVTLDGLGANGYPHNGFSGSDYGPADTLTSVTIDLENKDDVFISFFYQGGGNGNAPESIDSLVLEYYNNDTDQWDWQWSQPGIPSAAFEQVIMEISDEAYLFTDFRFRFRNYATIDGSFDHWNIDYVRLDENRSINDTPIIDVSFSQPEYTLLKNHVSAMPWTHYQESTGDNVIGTLDLMIRNLRTQGAFINETSIEVEHDGDVQINIIDPQAPSISPQSIIAVTQEINTSPNDYFYNPNIDDVSAEFNIKASLVSSPNENLENDHLYFTQKFLNYYDYSDHTSESNFGIADFAGSGNIACRVTATMEDSLEAVQISFFVGGINSENGNIIISVWENDGFQGSPGTILYESETIAHPIFTNQVDGFTTYMLDEKIWVDEDYYIGFKQTTPERIVVGVDKNTIPDTERIFYNLDGNWNPSGIQGIAMIRPQYQSMIDPGVGIGQVESDEHLLLWPNPANSYLNIRTDHFYSSVTIYDQLGQVVCVKEIINHQIDISDIPQGMYFLQFYSLEKNLNTSQKIVITR